MIKRTLYFSNPAYLKTKNDQLVIEMQDTGEVKTAPIEDIGLVILDHQQITITQSVIAKLLANNTALVTCDSTHHPTGMMLNLEGNSLQSLKFQAQLSASEPLKKQLWQQTVTAKIRNQAAVLALQRVDGKTLLNYAKEVKSGDADNQEAIAAAYYWRRVFPDFLEFKRERYVVIFGHEAVGQYLSPLFAKVRCWYKSSISSLPAATPSPQFGSELSTLAECPAALVFLSVFRCS